MLKKSRSTSNGPDRMYIPINIPVQSDHSPLDHIHVVLYSIIGSLVHVYVDILTHGVQRWMISVVNFFVF